MVEIAQALALLLLLEIAVLALLHIMNRKVLDSKGGRVEFALEWEGHRRTVMLATVAFVLLAIMEVIEFFDVLGLTSLDYAVEQVHALTLLFLIAALLPPLVYHIGLRGVKP